MGPRKSVLGSQERGEVKALRIEVARLPGLVSSLRPSAYSSALGDVKRLRRPGCSRRPRRRRRSQ